MNRLLSLPRLYGGGPLSFPRFRRLPTLSTGLCTLALAVSACGQARAQGIGMADADEWSAFRAASVAPAGGDPRPELAFQDVRQEGPWRRSTERALQPSEVRMLALLRQGDWKGAMAHLKAMKPDLNRQDETHATPLTLAVQGGQIELVREMLRQGAQPDDVGAGGMTPLGAAAYAGHDIIVTDLIGQGARIDVPGATGQTPLHLACMGGHARTAGLLMARGADWRLPNKAGRHALAEAAYFGRIEVMRSFADKGISPAEPDLHGLNAVHAAALGRQPAAVDWLRQRGVPVQSVLTELLIGQMRQPLVVQP